MGSIEMVVLSVIEAFLVLSQEAICLLILFCYAPREAFSTQDALLKLFSLVISIDPRFLFIWNISSSIADGETFFLAKYSFYISRLYPDGPNPNPMTN